MRSLVLALSFVVVGPLWAQAPAWEPLAVALAAGRPTLVYVQAPWCGPCRRLERETFADAAVDARLDRFALARLTIDDHDRTHRVGPYRLTEAAWAARLGAAATPTLVLLGPDGAVLGRVAGFVPPDVLLSILDAAQASVHPARP